MNKLTIAAATLFLASTAVAHAGNSISFQIEGQNIRIETPRNCASLDCVTIVAPGLSNKPIKLNNIKGFLHRAGFQACDFRLGPPRFSLGLEKSTAAASQRNKDKGADEIQTNSARHPRKFGEFI